MPTDGPPIVMNTGSLELGPPGGKRGSQASGRRPLHPLVHPPPFYALVIAAGTLALGASFHELARRPVGSAWLILLALTAVTGWSTLRMRDVPVSFSLSDTFTIAAALLFGPAVGTVTVVVDALIMSLRVASAIRRFVWAHVLFNVTAAPLAMFVAARVFFDLAQTGPLATDPGRIRDVILPLAVFAAIYFLLNTGFVAVAVAHERRADVAAVWHQHLSALWLTYFSGASIAGVLVLMAVARVLDVRTLMLILPLLVYLHVTYRGALDRAHEQIEQLSRIASYHAALRSTGDGVIVSDADGRVTLVNPAAEALTGWSEPDARGRPAAVVYQVREAATDAEVDSPADAGGRLREYVLIARNGSERPIEAMHTAVTDHRGMVIGTIRTFRDISPRKHIEAEREALLDRERRARNAADAANRLKDEFLTTLSHELRTPTTGILGWVRLLRTGRLSSEETGHALQALDRSARSQATVLEDLLDTSRIVRGALRLEVRPLDVRHVVRTAIETMEPAIRSKALRLEVEFPDEMPLVDGDPDRLRQVFWNLIANAVKFTDANGSIRVAARLEADRIDVDVEDTGRGIDPQTLPFIFDRFRQADGSSTRAHGGLGLGLAIARHIVEAHGGTITADSRGLGSGARFTVRLPRPGDRPLP
jgi:PAS domain S-box-containing protein